MKDPLFECRKCGQCCSGQGGIVLAPLDLARLCSGLEMTEENFINAYALKRNGKLNLRMGEDGMCVFFKNGTGCAVHPHKPDICRAWPFFRGNMVDPVSLTMAKDFCPGINPKAEFQNFVAEGRQYLNAHNLATKDSSNSANALMVDLS